MNNPKSLVKVRCKCGDEILLLPDLKETGKAIDNHVNMHIQNLRAPSCTLAEAERLKDFLIGQVLRAASQSEDEDNW
jgi:hypothetical protein